MTSPSRSDASDGSALCFICLWREGTTLKTRAKPSNENLQAESSNNQLLATFQGLWDNDSDTNIAYYHQNSKHQIFHAAKTSSRKQTSDASLEREESRKERSNIYVLLEILKFFLTKISVFAIMNLFAGMSVILLKQKKHTLDQTIKLLTD